MLDKDFLVYNIVSHYHLASIEEKIKGLNWYQQAFKIANLLAIRYEVETSTVCGIMSALSVSTSWKRTIIDTEVLLQNLTIGCLDFKVTTYKNQKNKALNIYSIDSPALLSQIEEILKGNKTISFFNNIFNPNNPCYVTIDRHAVDVALNRYIPRKEVAKFVNTDKKYNLFKEAYIQAANLVSLCPNQIQAITWLRALKVLTHKA
jgi:hypothetical protein